MSNNTKQLLYSAEQINHRLSLIDENKNRLPYPYDNLYYANLPADLINVGDGSILTAVRSEGSTSTLLLNDCTLEGGKKYIISLNITDILEKVVDNSLFSLKVECNTDESLTKDNITGSYVLNLTAKADDTTTTVLIYLNIPTTFEANLLIKPQIEVQPIINDIPSESPSDWVPNMDKIGTYVDRRFNGTNVKLKEIAKKVESLSTLTEDERHLTKLLDFIDCIELE